MRPVQFLLFALTALLGLAFTGCIKDKCERTVTYIRVEPVFKTLDEIRSGQIVQEAPRELVHPGQIYFYNNLIFVNEGREGVHVIDNANPASPANIAFISIPGNEHIAIKDGILYANSYIDLIAISLQSYQALNRVENVFPPLWEDVNNNSVAVYYKETPITEVMDCERYGGLYKRGDVLYESANPNIFLDNLFLNNNSGSSESGGGTGIGGSMARFSIVGDYLYVVDQSKMNIFDLNMPTQPSLAGTVDIGWGIETIFPYGDKLFIGSNDGMFIFDNSNPQAPVQLARFGHVTSCDPVVVKDNYAYVTLRSGTACQGFTNQLDLIDISTITNPKLVKSFPMKNPHGLSIQGDNLFLCEGNYGLKSFDIKIPQELDKHLLEELKNLHAFDAIALPGAAKLLLVIGEDGFYQYNFDNPSKLKLLSTIPVRRP